jgi:endonuclease/exonuclease/phosphatase family metal-dependent hydrolase
MPKPQRLPLVLAAALLTLGLLAVFAPHIRLRLDAPTAAVSVLGGVVGGTEGAAVPMPDALTVVSYNIAHGRGSGSDNFNGEDAETRAHRLDEIAAFLREQDADIVVLNEVDFDTTWSHGVNQARHIAEAAGYPHRVEQRNFDVSVPLFRAAFGNAILSRVPIIEASRIPYPALSRVEAALAGHKQGVVATLAFSDGAVRVAAVHLSHRDETVRHASAALLLGQVADGPPLIVAGDFNSVLRGMPGWEANEEAAGGGPGAEGPSAEGQSALDLMASSALVGHPANRARSTYPSTAPALTLDWVFVDPRLTVQTLQAPAGSLSDHLPLVAVVGLQGRE